MSSSSSYHKDILWIMIFIIPFCICQIPSILTLHVVAFCVFQTKSGIDLFMTFLCIIFIKNIIGLNSTVGFICFALSCILFSYLCICNITALCCASFKHYYRYLEHKRKTKYYYTYENTYDEWNELRSMNQTMLFAKYSSRYEQSLGLCGICREQLTHANFNKYHPTVMTNGCGHLYHSQCLYDHLMAQWQQGQSHCAYCRSYIHHYPDYTTYDPSSVTDHQLMVNLLNLKIDDIMVKKLKEMVSTMTYYLKNMIQNYSNMIGNHSMVFEQTITRPIYYI